MADQKRQQAEAVVEPVAVARGAATLAIAAAAPFAVLWAAWLYHRPRGTAGWVKLLLPALAVAAFPLIVRDATPQLLADRQLAWIRELIAHRDDLYEFLTSRRWWWFAVNTQVWLTPLLAVGFAWGNALADDVRPDPAAGDGRRKKRGGYDYRGWRMFVPAHLLWPSRVIGRYISGDLAQPSRRFAPPSRWWVAGRSVLLSKFDLLHHIVVLGQSGYGKTVTLYRIMRYAWRHGFHVHFLDCKGREERWHQFVSHALAAGLSEHEVGVWPLEHYDLWRGDGRQIANRIATALDYSDPYFKGVAVGLVMEACEGDEPPRSAGELISRLEQAAARRQGMDRDHARTAVQRFRGLFAAVGDPRAAMLDHTDERNATRSVSSIFDGGWAAEDVRASLWSLPGLGMQEHTRAAGRMILQDFAAFIADSNRRSGGRDILVIDELATLVARGDAGGDVQALIEQVREAGVGVVLAGQTIEGLGPNAEPIVQSAGTVIAHRLAKPGFVCELAGTVTDKKRTHTVADDKTTKSGSLADRERFKLAPNDVGSLEVGEAAIVSGRRALLAKMRAYTPRARFGEAATEALEEMAANPLCLPDDDYPDEPAVEVIDVERDDAAGEEKAVPRL